MCPSEISASICTRTKSTIINNLALCTRATTLQDPLIIQLWCMLILILILSWGLSLVFVPDLSLSKVVTERRRCKAAYVYTHSLIFRSLRRCATDSSSARSVVLVRRTMKLDKVLPAPSRRPKCQHPGFRIRLQGFHQRWLAMMLPQYDLGPLRFREASFCRHFYCFVRVHSQAAIRFTSRLVLLTA